MTKAHQWISIDLSLISLKIFNDVRSMRNIAYNFSKLPDKFITEFKWFIRQEKIENWPNVLADIHFPLDSIKYVSDYTNIKIILYN